MNNGSMHSKGLAAEFAQHGDVEVVALSHLQKLAAQHLSRNWALIPHVTHHDEADVTELEALRRSLQESSQSKVSALAFYVKAVAEALRKFPRFAASLDSDDNTLILKKYCHIGVAVDTPRGLLVPVVRDCDRKSVLQISSEIGDLASRARSKGLPMNVLVGGCFTISSLGKEGGIAFTPIINGREVAILGISRLLTKPEPNGEGIEWRVKVPLSLSYDHRVINGAEAAKFMTYLRELITAPRELLD